MVSGEAEKEVKLFLSDEGKSLAEYKVQIQYYRDLSAEITALDDVVLFDMFILECHDIKHGLNELVHSLTTMLVKQLAEKHLDESARYIDYVRTYIVHTYVRILIYPMPKDGQPKS